MPTREDSARLATASRWACRVGLALLPLVLALVGYYRPVLRGAPLPRLAGDGAFYVYQLTRACERGGRWWEVGADERVGRPYPPVTAKHPGIFEGVDLMLAAALTGRVLGPTANYHAMALLMLAINGWVAAWMAYRLTRSYGWAALAVLLITLNDPTAGRVGGHLHLFKFAWILLAVGAFGRYLETPTRGRGLALGLAIAWALQGSFYLGFLLAIGLAAWWLGCLAGGRLGRAHVRATLAAGLGLAAAGAALTFPVWTSARSAVLAGQYFQRSRLETWLYGAELWQYFVPPDSGPAADYIAAFQQKGPGAFWEGWYYPGHVVLLAVAAYAIARLRGRTLGAGDPRFLDLAMGLIGVFVVLSLAGGPAFLVYQWFPGFRCYGRAGLLALALGCVAAPAILQGATGAIRHRGLRGAAVAGVFALAAYDAAASAGRFHFAEPASDPAWSTWLARQPADVRLAAFAPRDGDPFGWWGFVGLDQRLKHRHATLNGGEFALLEGDLALVGASYDRMTPDGLRLVVSLGYDTLAFHRDYLAANPWIAGLPWLDRLDEAGGWSIYRANAWAPCYPTVNVGRLLDGLGGDAPRVVPAGAWITAGIGGDQDRVVTEPTRLRVAWEDGRARPTPALFQHVFGPGLPAYTVLTPEGAGTHRLAVLDETGRRLAAVSYVVNPRLKTGRAAGELVEGEGQGGAIVHGDGPVRVALSNDGRGYFQAHAYRDPSLGVASVQPGMSPPTSGSLVLRVRPIDPPGPAVDRLLPADLPPGGRLEIDLPGFPGGPRRVEVRPRLVWPGTDGAPADVRVTVVR